MVHVSIIFTGICMLMRGTPSQPATFMMVDASEARQAENKPREIIPAHTRYIKVRSTDLMAEPSGWRTSFKTIGKDNKTYEYFPVCGNQDITIKATPDDSNSVYKQLKYDDDGSNAQNFVADPKTRFPLLEVPILNKEQCRSNKCTVSKTKPKTLVTAAFGNISATNESRLRYRLAGHNGGNPAPLPQGIALDLVVKKDANGTAVILDTGEVGTIRLTATDGETIQVEIGNIPYADFVGAGYEEAADYHFERQYDLLDRASFPHPPPIPRTDPHDVESHACNPSRNPSGSNCPPTQWQP